MYPDSIFILFVSLLDILITNSIENTTVIINLNFTTPSKSRIRIS